jgi:uncharacterized protein (DUF4415 family)
MKKRQGTVRYSAKEIEAMRRRGQDKTDDARLDLAAVDAEEEGDFDWARAEVGIPAPKQQLTVRFDGDLVQWFKSQGSGYQTRMNAVLRRFMDTQKSNR